MDARLVSWGRQVKARQPGAVPPLWLFTDAARGGDVLRAVRGLPAGLCGVVFRHDAASDRAALLGAVARLCRARRLALTVAGDGPLPPGAGRHLRDGRGRCPAGRLSTSSAHGRAALVRARRAGAALAFLSPVLPTQSHPGAAALGPWRFGRIARAAGLPVAALGGMTGGVVRRVPASAVGAIGALSPLGHSVSRLP